MILIFIADLDNYLFHCLLLYICFKNKFGGILCGCGLDVFGVFFLAGSMQKLDALIIHEVTCNKSFPEIQLIVLSLS